MKRENLEHIIRAAAAITNQYEFIVVGSQSILGAIPDAPKILLQSREADIYPLQAPDLADLIDGSIGEHSAFDTTFGYYAQGVGPDTAVLPKGWEQRLVKIQNSNTDLKIGYCLEPHDLAVSKLAAGREKDWPFVEAMLRYKLIGSDILLERLAVTSLSPPQRAKLESWVKSWDRDS